MRINSDDYRPYWLESYQNVNEGYVILTIFLIHYNALYDDFIHQIHLRTKHDLSATQLFGDYGFDRYINEKVPIFLYEEIQGQLSVFEGYELMESEVSFMIDYVSVEYKSIEKTASDWKKEFIKLSEKYDALHALHYFNKKN
jgi:hypothetical protein